jgi:hydroxyisourate hydrolase
VPVTLEELNRLPEDQARTAFERCCGASKWVRSMSAARPYAHPAALFTAADRAADALGPEDWREAFAHHPRIGDLASLRERFTATAAWAGDEQRSAASASEEILAALARGNRDYEARFGYIFIVCATGRSAADMLEFLERRLGNDPERELEIAALEQRKITRLRLEKLLAEPKREPAMEDRMNGITTHVLDLAAGRPAAGMTVRLDRLMGTGWSKVAEQATDDDGRARELLPAGAPPEAGIYRLTFATRAYFHDKGTPTFYPEVSVTFEVGNPAQHYHVPLLVSPWGYSTYRGS